MTGVTYIPTQTPDESTFTSDRVALRSPIRLLIQDALVLFENLEYIPNVFLPNRTLKPLPGVDKSRIMSVRDTILTLNVLILELTIMVIAVPASLYLRGWQMCLFIAAVMMTIYLLELPMWGGLIVHSQIELEDSNKFGKERWHFINGIATNYDGLQTTCDRLAATFRRRIIGVHNRSYGVIGDVLECMIQRCFSYNTSDVRCTYEVLKLHILDPSVDKVVVIAHSQGGIIISLALDRMFAEMPSRALSKLEIYTFGSAASHFNNPLTHSSLTSLIHATSTPQTLLPRPTHVIPTIEHYANELDLVPRWGVVNSARHCTATRYAGRVFIAKGASGHLFNEHYLEPMFPLLTVSNKPDTSSPSDRGDYKKNKAGNNTPSAPEPDASISSAEDQVGADAEGSPVLQPLLPHSDAGQPKLSPFLDRMVDVDHETALRRAESVETQSALGEGAGKTVRQLSRLWMYVGGGEVNSREGL
ncbi:uncharacterized protein K452DRAFT_75157 [Aplosporella prunicola CBS 121167]|uniref:DUF676 domain-containing protein n=1 Tax=Aplosporella prunicola CBS 121167 TaxID=1176127 RepID=A0A6A6B7Y1_9PEZI|nr:uncharacterized protein K452DRAFT_75157 [Aplosporella prunicola CBS 121167]KAF2139314.1 hypothetical protein K452DRAFT_75157 [Aplosporella prunicola CBS 121167]